VNRDVRNGVRDSKSPIRRSPVIVVSFMNHRQSPFDVLEANILVDFSNEFWLL
jgi:hypothetical protein